MRTLSSNETSPDPGKDGLQAIGLNEKPLFGQAIKPTFGRH
jgi:hypothetical protein